MPKKILLTGVYINKISKNVPPIIEELKGVEITNSIEEEFGGVKFGAENNSLACWCCGLYFDTEAYSIPIFITTDVVENNNNRYAIYKNLQDADTYEENRIIKKYGNFCSLPCASRFLLEDYEIPLPCKKNYTKLLCYVYRDKLKSTINYIPPAYPRYKMKQYGGSWTEEEFRTANEKILHEFLSK